MTICKFWQQGNCRNGNSCRFEHPGAGGGGGGGGGGRGNGNNRNDNRFGALSGGGGGGGKVQSGLDKYRISTDTIKTDLTEDAPTWILSAYAPGRDAPEQLFGGPQREQSFEEMRLRHLEARAAGNEQAALNDAQSMYTEAQRQMQHAISNAGQAAQFVLEGENKRPNRFDICREGTQGAPFGKFALGNRPAGGQQQQQQQSANPFGAPSGPATGFGQPNPFGGPPAATQTPAFGQPSQPGAFGQPSGLGQPSFGQPSALGANQSGFGKPAFGQPSQPGGSTPAFGQPSQPGPTSGFGQPSALGQKPNPFGQPAFGQPSQPAAPSGFGQPSQPAAPSGFGQPSQPAAPSGFGQPSQPAAPSGFGQPSQPAAPSGFGQPSQPAATQSPFGQPSQPAFGQPSMPGAGATSPFGQSPTANPNPFGGALNAKPNPFSMDGPGVDTFRKPMETATKSDPFSMNGPGANTFRSAQSQPFGSAAPLVLQNPYPPTSSRTHPSLESYADRGPDGRLTGFKGRPVTYRDGVPGYTSQDGRWHRVYFPDGPPALNNDTALPDDQYDDVTRSQWEGFAQTGTFLNGLLPALAPPRDCTRWDF